MILTNAATLMNKWTLSTNNFEKTILDKNTSNKIFFEILEDYIGVYSTNLHGIEQKLENAFLAKFSIFFENFVTLEH